MGGWERIIFLSDVHIGTNNPVNWYQKRVHEPYLLAVLGYVERLGNQVRDLVLLEDLIDQWTVVADQAPPSVKDIFEHNPDVFAGDEGKPGALVRCVHSVAGDVCYVNGNHDMFLKPADLESLRDREGKAPRYLESSVPVSLTCKRNPTRGSPPLSSS